MKNPQPSKPGQSTTADDAQEQATIQTYDVYAESWASEHSDRSGFKPVVAKLQEFLPKGSLLEVGAGGGADAELLTAAGYDYLGTDVSKGMLYVARAAHPGLEFEQCSVYDLASLGRQFDGFWACAVLLHIPKRRIDEAFQAIAAVIRQNGVGFIAIKAGDHEEFERREKSGRQENRLFALWSKEDFTAVLNRNGFEVVWYEYVPVSERTNWHRFIVRKGDMRLQG